MEHYSKIEKGHQNFHDDLNVILVHLGSKLLSNAQYLHTTALSFYEISEQDFNFHRHGGFTNMYRPSFYRANLGLIAQSMSAVCFAGAKIIIEHVERRL